MLQYENANVQFSPSFFFPFILETNQNNKTENAFFLRMGVLRPNLNSLCHGKREGMHERQDSRGPDDPSDFVLDIG
jgi:hypothetical protein